MSDQISKKEAILEMLEKAKRIVEECSKDCVGFRMSIDCFGSYPVFQYEIKEMRNTY